MITVTPFTHYALLRISPDAQTCEIEQAFRDRIAALPQTTWRRRLWTCATCESETSLRLACTILCDPESRRRYDLQLSKERWLWFPIG